MRSSIRTNTGRFFTSILTVAPKPNSGGPTSSPVGTGATRKVHAPSQTRQGRREVCNARMLPKISAPLFGAEAIALFLILCVPASAQTNPALPRLSYHHVGEGRSDRETLARTFAMCKLQADVAAPMIEGSWQSLISWQLARDDCMRAHGWVRD